MMVSGDVLLCVHVHALWAAFFLVPHRHVGARSGLGCARQGGARYAQLCWWGQ